MIILSDGKGAGLRPDPHRFALEPAALIYDPVWDAANWHYLPGYMRKPGHQMLLDLTEGGTVTSMLNAVALELLK